MYTFSDVSLNMIIFRGLYYWAWRIIQAFTDWALCFTSSQSYVHMIEIFYDTRILKETSEELKAIYNNRNFMKKLSKIDWIIILN